MKKTLLVITWLFVYVSSVGQVAQKTEKLTDDQLLDLVQKQTFAYFWDFGHPTSGLARERSNQSFGYGDETTTTGGTGFGVMSIVVASERKWITRTQAAERCSENCKIPFKSRCISRHFPALVKWQHRQDHTVQSER
jgi:hypothetical protein